MAVLKDLIVHGNSKFLNGANFKSLNSESIGAEQGIFNKLIATTLDATTATIDDLTAKNATVTALLDVQGDMHTNSWSNSNIATIDGSFYITPTSVSNDGSDVDASGYTPTGTITYSSSNFTKLSITGTFDTSQLTLNNTAHVAWPANSEVIVSGDVLVGNEWLPLGTIRGKLESQVAATNASKTISVVPLSTTLTDGQGHTPITLETIRVGINLTSGTSSVLKMRKIKVSLTSRASGSTQYPVGILLSAQGTGTGQTFIDIYGGNNTRNGQSGTINGSTKTFTKPMVRLGNLEGLPKIANQTPSGWGIYTSNGFFEGAIVAKEGYIGNTGAYWTIGGGTSSGATYMYSGPSTVSATSTAGTYLGTNGFLNTASSTTYAQITGGVLTAQGAVISGTIDATSFKARDSNQKVRAEVNTNGLLIYDSDGTVVTNGTLLAQFGSTTQIGKSAQAHINITSGGLDLYKGTTGFANLITHLGYGSSDDNTLGDTTNIPYFTLGTRKKSQAEYATSYIPGIYSVTMGLDNVAQGSYAIAVGNTTEAIGHYSYAEGSETYAIGDGSHAGGRYSEANGDYSFAHGDHTKATAEYQVVFGKYNEQDSEAMFIIGNGTDGNNRSNLMVIGDDYARIGNKSATHIELSSESFDLMVSDAVGIRIITDNSNNEIIEGTGTGDGSTKNFYFNSDHTSYVSPTLNAEISAFNATINGEPATAYKPTVNWVRGSGQLEIKCVYFSIAPPINSVVKFSVCINGKNHIHVGTDSLFDSSTYGVNSVAIGRSAKSSGNNSLAAGSNCTASGSSSVAFNSAGASAQSSFAANMGDASASYSAAFGDSDTYGMYSFATGQGTIARTASQVVVGKYNKDDTNGDYAFIVGNGEFSIDSQRSNALTIDWSGNIIAQGMAGMIQMTVCPAGGPGNTPLIPEDNTTVYEPIPGWLICNGAAVSRTTYATLFAVIGTNYGAGDGSTTFNLPDFRGRVPVGAGTGTATDATLHILGTPGGTETVTLTANQSGQRALSISGGAHSHTFYYGGMGSGSRNSLTVYNAGGTGNYGSGGSHTHSVAAADATEAHSNMQPYLGINYIICTGKTS